MCQQRAGNEQAMHEAMCNYIRAMSRRCVAGDEQVICQRCAGNKYAGDEQAMDCVVDVQGSR